MSKEKLLTGKCLEDFEQWLRLASDHRYSELITICFDNFPLAMQWGVILEFADSKGYHITTYQMHYQNWFGYEITAILTIGHEIIEKGVWRRKECMEEAVKHFNKLYNEKYRT